MPTMPQDMHLLSESSDHQLASYPTSEILRHAPSLSEACIFEIAPGQLNYAILTYAEEHFKNVNTFTVGARPRKDQNGEDTIGEMFRRYMGGRSRFHYVTSQKSKSSKVPELAMALGTGTYGAEWEGKKIWVCHYLKDKAVSGPNHPLIFQRVILFTYLEGVEMGEMKKALMGFANMCLEWHHNKTFTEPGERNFRLFRFKVEHGCGDWRYEGEKRARSAESVVLKKNLQEEILKDFERFLSEKSKNWYVKHGVPRRRSYLLYGEPGSGKTSMIKVLASRFKLNACFLSLASRHIDNQVLNDAISTLPAEALLVLEDVDTLFTEDRKSKDGVNITYSTLLQVLDGIPSGEGRLTIMTTNHVTKLDSAMIRCGRVDRMFHIGAPDKQQIEDYFKTFYPDCTQETRTKFSNHVLKRNSQEKSMATLQQFFIFAQDDSSEVAVSRLDEFYDKFFEARLPEGTPILYT